MIEELEVETDPCSAFLAEYPDFEIKENDCEINGLRLYLVEKGTRLRVRLFSRTRVSLNDALLRFREGKENNRLYLHPEGE